MKKKRNIMNMLILILLIVAIAGTFVIALYPIKNRTLTVKFEKLDNEIYEVERNSAGILENEEWRTLELPGRMDFSIKNVQIVGRLKSISLKDMDYGTFGNYIEGVQGGTLEYTDKGLVFTETEGPIVITFKQTLYEELRRLTQSALLERLIICAYFYCIIAVCIIACKAAEEKKLENQYKNHGPVAEMQRFFRDVAAYKQYIIYSAKTDLRAEVADSYLNRLWWLLEPMFNMLVYVIVFGQILGNSIENYATFVFSALILWNYFNKIISYSVKLVRNNKDIVTKIYIPKFVILLSNMVLNFYKFLFSLVVLVVMMLVFRVSVGVQLLAVIPVYVALILLSFGLGMILLHFGVFVDDLSYAVGILLNMLMFLSGVFYDVMMTLPEPLNTLMLCLNPIALYIDTMRNALLNKAVVNVPIMGVWIVASIIVCYIGMHIVYKNENGYVKVV